LISRSHLANENSGLAAFDGEISRMQGGRLHVALAHIGEFNKGAHCVGDAGNPACMFLIRKYASAQTGLSASRCGYKVEHAKQPSVVGPQFEESKSRLASQSDETFRRMLVGMLGQNFLTSAEMKLSILYANRLIGRADQIHLDAACFRVVNSTVLPPG